MPVPILTKDPEQVNGVPMPGAPLKAAAGTVGQIKLTSSSGDLVTTPAVFAGRTPHLLVRCRERAIGELF